MAHRRHKSDDALTASQSPKAAAISSFCEPVNGTTASGLSPICSWTPDQEFLGGDLIDLSDQNTLNNNNRSKTIPMSSRMVSDELVEAINQHLLNELKAKNAPKSTDKDSSPSNGTVNSANGVADSMSSGKRFKQNPKRLNNSVDLTNVQGDDVAVEQTAQHKTAIREFKRLSTYCTLRPEQRRKHLLKVLPTLRNSKLLQTLLASSNGEDVVKSNDQLLQNNDIDSLLINLDEFIIDGNELIKQDASVNRDNNNFAPNSENRGEAINDEFATENIIPFDLDKVEDCLLELDAYLEQIDRDYALTCAYGFAHNNVNCANGKHKINNNNNQSSILTSTAPIDSVRCNQSGNGERECLSDNDGSSSSRSNSDSLNENDNGSGVQSEVIHQNVKRNIEANGIHTGKENANKPMSDALADWQFLREAAGNHSIRALRKHFSHSDVNLNQSGTICNNQGRNTNDGRLKTSPDETYSKLRRGHRLRNTIAITKERSSRAPATAAAAAAITHPIAFNGKSKANISIYVLPRDNGWPMNGIEFLCVPKIT